MIDTQKIKALREATGASMVDCQKILAKTKGDFEAAKKILSEKSKRAVGKKTGRLTSEGIVEAYIHSNRKIGALVELACETDFVAKNPLFLELAHNIAMHIAAANPLCVDSPEFHPEILARIEEEKKKALAEFGGKKPKEMIENIIAGKIKKYTASVSLLSQEYVKDPQKTVGDIINETIAKIGENIRVKRFCRFQIE
ncbi:elongation factor Ts [Patescibacteria group bacterium]|nr:elongation factor Ts [Patescibacteria group bacterium]MBU4000178.1 elongation factor Ts [Patescibacteria group bacterium]MBU4056423.1 elongation factor Ts [Patescibacteria group bacterium]MBU4368680.1 elongation factor Ts [Patescibacteria group bacterium]